MCKATANQDLEHVGVSESLPSPDEQLDKLAEAGEPKFVRVSVVYLCSVMIRVWTLCNWQTLFPAQFVYVLLLIVPKFMLKTPCQPFTVDV